MKPPTDQNPQPIYRKDYTEPDFSIDSVDLEFELGEEATTVHARLAVRRNESAAADAPLQLNGEKLELVRVAIDDRELAASEFRSDEGILTVPEVPDAFTFASTVVIKPQENTELSGLYKSSGNFCSQCEAEGFRRITYFLDRPDVMATYRVKITADATRYPVMLSNGNRVGSGTGDGGTHWVQWEDPFKKPSYLFALVAGDLRCHEGSYRTMSGRDIKLEIWVEPENLDKCDHALTSLQKSMKWDEDTFGLEYDLDLFMIVAIRDFNMGAMENKGLNIFNSKYILASPDSATDAEYEAIEGVIAHEYFHNWTGNRVTCRDWFQLTLKEGLTVFRDQQFSMDVQSAPVKRIEDVKILRTAQFAEDAGPMAHPIRPEYYIEMNNFYTATVYVKGAEVVRMYQTLLGRDGFRKGMDLYFERHDGQAVTCDDFRAAMADANGVDLDQLDRWYLQAGTPTVAARGEWSAETREYALTLSQSFPLIPKLGEPQPALVPVAVGLLDGNGDDMDLGGGATTRVLQLTEAEQTFTFAGVPEQPTPSILRGFSAPARLEVERSREELGFLAAHDSDAFNRWEAGQDLAKAVILEMARDWRAGKPLAPEPLLVEAARRVLADPGLDGSMKALALALPDERFLVQQTEVWDPEAIHEARFFCYRAIADALSDELRATYEANRPVGPYAFDRPSIDRRSLKNRALSILSCLESAETTGLVKEQFDSADNMTDSWQALRLLADVDAPQRDTALGAFYERWRSNPLVLDKWFQAQACSRRTDTLEIVRALFGHADFDVTNPNRARALLIGFSVMNPVRFHDASGAGYELVADKVLELDDINPQVAARVVSAFNQWKRYDETRQAQQKAQLERIAAKQKLSKDVFEIVGRALGR